MNAFIYDEKGTLFVRKPNGLEYDYTTVDKPAFDFDFDVIIYDDIEVKIVNWEDGLSFDQQAKTALSNEEKDMIEQYIENSEPPMGHSLNSQMINNLYRQTKDYVDKECQQYNFDSLTEVVYAGREGSSHPFRNNARRAMEYADAVNCVLEQLVNEIQSTREDFIKEYDSYVSELPSPYIPEETRQ